MYALYSMVKFHPVKWADKQQRRHEGGTDAEWRQRGTAWPGHTWYAWPRGQVSAATGWRLPAASHRERLCHGTCHAGNSSLTKAILTTSPHAHLLWGDWSRLLILLWREGTRLLLSDDMGNADIQGLSSGQRHVVGQQGRLLHDSAILAAVRVGAPAATERNTEDWTPESLGN